MMTTDGQNDLLREFLNFSDDLRLPDKPFQAKKEALDFDHHFEEDFFVGATPSPSSSSSSNVGTSSTATPTNG